MRRTPALGIGGLLSLVGGAIARGIEISGSSHGFPSGVTCTRSALAFVACGKPVAPACIDDVASQAVAFCTSYLSVTATSLATTTEITTVTVTETETSETIALETSTSVAGTAILDVSTTTETVTSTSASTTTVPPEIVTVTVKRRGLGFNLAQCPDLPKKRLTRLPASGLSSVCSCLGVTATTDIITQTSTASSSRTESATITTTSTTTSTTIIPSISTTSTTSTTTTTTSTVVSETATVDWCSIRYSSDVGQTPGNAFLRPGGVSNAEDCCRLCWSTLDCVASSFTSIGECQLLVKLDPSTGGAVSAECPLGQEEYPYIDTPGGNVFKGPCGGGL